jgi:hypothetical protein
MIRFCQPAAAALLTALIAALLLAGCGGSETTTVTVEVTEATEAESGPTEAVLKPVGEQSAAKGTARYSLNPNRVPSLHVELEGLKPVSGAARYGIWMYGDRHDMVMLGAFQTDEEGRISRQFETIESYTFVEQGSKTELLVTKVGDLDKIGEGIGEDGSPWDPAIIGEPVLQGPFEGPYVGSSEPGE